jgi:UDP-N-acetylmuramate--alanine ligase
LLDELAETLQNADKVFVAEIFRAREGAPREGEVTAADLSGAVRRGGAEVCDVHAIEEIVGVLQDGLAEGDVLLTLGAGNIGTICDYFARRIHGGLEAA